MHVLLLAAVVAAPPAAASIDVAPYRSVFADYRAWNADEPVANWKRANDEMKALGGHAGHLRGAAPAVSRPPERAQQAPAQPQQQGKPAASGGHEAHHGLRQ